MSDTDTKWVVYHSPSTDRLGVDGPHDESSDLAETLRILTLLGCSDFQVMRLKATPYDYLFPTFEAAS